MTTRDDRDAAGRAEHGDPMEARVVDDLIHYYAAPTPPDHLRASLRRLANEQTLTQGQPAAPLPRQLPGSTVIRALCQRRERPRFAWAGWAIPVLLTLVVVGVTTSYLLPRGKVGTAWTSVVRTVTVGSQPVGPPIVDERTGRAFVSLQGDHTVRVLDTRTGAVLRTLDEGGGTYVWLAVAAGTGRVYLSDWTNSTISVLDGRTGAVLHTTPVAADSRGDRSAGPLAVDERTGRVFMAHLGGATVTMLDPRNGAAVRQLAACQGIVAIAVSMGTGHVFVKCNDGTTAMLDERTGHELARASTESTYGCVLVDERTNRAFTPGYPTTGQPHLDMLDAQTGRFLRAIPGIGPQGSIAQATGGRQDCPYLAVDERTGRVYAALLGQRTLGSAVVVLDGQTGAVLHRYPVADNPVSLAVDGQTGYVLVASAGKVNSAGLPLDNGTVSVLDGTSGRVLRTIEAGMNPAAVVIDERARRALVLNSNTDINGMGLMTNPRAKGTVITLDLSRL
jgi:DNA-binding beta-propeller fold protein YncE